MDILLTITVINCGIVIIPTLEMHFFIQVNYITSQFCEVSLLVLLILYKKTFGLMLRCFLTLTCMILVTHYLLWTCMVSKD